MTPRRTLLVIVILSGLVGLGWIALSGAHQLLGCEIVDSTFGRKTFTGFIPESTCAYDDVTFDQVDHLEIDVQQRGAPVHLLLLSIVVGALAGWGLHAEMRSDGKAESDEPTISR